MVCAFIRYTSQKLMTKPATIYAKSVDTVLTAFSPFDIKCKKLNLAGYL